MSSPDPALSTLFGTVAIEQLVKGSSGFAETEAMVTSIFGGPNGQAELARLIANRHQIAHEGKAPEDPDAHVRGILATWAVISMASMAAADGLSFGDFLEHLRGRVKAKEEE